MEKKIEKLEGSYDVPQLKQKLNEVIDYLNTQPQTEEKTKLVMPPSAYEQAEKEGFNMKNKVKSELLPESTPEQTESDEQEWEKRFDKRYDQYNPINDDGTQVATWCGSDYEDMKSFISELLEEREREVFTKEEWFMLKLAMNKIHNEGNGAYDEIGEKIERMLSKLNKKK